VEDHYSWRKVTGSEAMRYWIDESQMENCSWSDLLTFDDQLSAIVRLCVFFLYSSLYSLYRLIISFCVSPHLVPYTCRLISLPVSF